MLNKKLILGIMLLGLVGNNNTKAMQLNTLNSQVNSSESSKSEINKNKLNDLLKNFRDFSETFEAKFSPQNVNIDDSTLNRNYAEIWREYNSYFENELSWIVDTFSDSPNEVTKEIVDQLSERIEIFKNKVLNLKSKIEKIQTEQSRKDAWQRVFFTDGNYKKIKNEVGEASANRTDEDSKKIASVIDSYLPGTYDNILGLCNVMKMEDITPGVLVSGAPGWGKTQGVEYLIAATNAQKIVVSYSDLLKSGDGRKYAENLLNEYRNKKEPLIMVFDEFDVVANKDDLQLISFFDKVKEIAENSDNNINLKLIIMISNMDKKQFNPGIVQHFIHQCFVFGNNPDYKRIIDSISQVVNCDPAEIKEDFINNIAEHCENLRDSGKAPSARIILKAFQSAQAEWLAEGVGRRDDKDDKIEGPWNSVLNSQDIIKRINSFCSL